METSGVWICYGRSVPSIADQLKCTPEEAQAIYDKVTKSFPGLLKAQDAAAVEAHKYGYVSDLWGRRRHLSVMLHDDYEFEYLDGCNPNFDPLDPLSALDIQDNQLSPEEAKVHLKKLQEMKWWKDKQAYIDYIRSEFGIITHDYSRQRKDTKRQLLNAKIQGSAASMSKLAMISIDTDPLLLENGCQLLLMVHDEVICEAPKDKLEIVVPRIQYLMENVASHLPVPFKSDAEVSEHWYGTEIEYHDQEAEEE